MSKVRFWEAVASLVGMIVGAGLLGLPYAINKFGAVRGLIILIVIGVLFAVQNLMFAEIVLRTKYRHQLIGFARKYLGRLAQFVETIFFLFDNYGVILAYVIGEGVVLSVLLGADAALCSMVFLLIMSFILIFNLRVLKVVELWLVIGFLLIMAAILAGSHGRIDLNNFTSGDWGYSMMAYGVILFACGGATAVVTLREILRGNEKLVKKAVLWGSIIPIVIYVLFTVAVIGVAGQDTTEVATVGLGAKVGAYMIVCGNLFAAFAMATSFLTKGQVLKEIFIFDFKLSKLNSWLLIVVVPFLLFMLGVRDFITILSIVGGLSMGVTGAMIVAIFWKAKRAGDREPEFSLPKLKFIGWLLIAMFLLGTAYTLFQLC